jgi:tetratricopeptide (TPR) repeat protein
MMTGFDGHRLPPPRDWQKFERLCRDLWAEIWNDPTAQANGRSGQPQHGVDVYGCPNGGASLSAVQCKLHGETGEVTEAELREEVAKARGFEPRLRGAFIVATTGPRDAKIQEVARKITEEHAAEQLFSVHVWGWEDIEAEIGKHPTVFAAHYGDIVQTVRALEREKLPEIPSGTHAVAYAHGSGAMAIALSVGGGGISLDPEHRAQIDSVRAILKKGQAKLALEQAEALRTRIWAAASGPAKAHLLALVAHAKLELGEHQDAARLLVQGVEHAPTDAPAQANAALGHLLLGSEKAAQAWAQKALSQVPSNPIAVQVSVILDERPDAEVLAAHEATFGARSELLLALGQRALKRRELSIAQGWFDKATTKEPENASGLAIAGQVRIDRVTQRVGPEGVPTAADLADLQRAVELLERAWALVKDEAVRRARAEWIAARTFAKHLLGAPDAAASGDELLTIGGEREEFVMLRASIAAQAGDNKKVIELLDRLASPNPDARGARAAARANLGDWSGSLAEWEAMLALQLPQDLRNQVERNYVHVLATLDRVGEARATIERWLTEKPDDLSRVLIAIETGVRIGDRVLRDSHLDRAVALARADAAPRLLLRLGDALMRAERAGDAADVYALVPEVDDDPTYARRRVQALYESGRFESALQACRRMTERGSAERFCAETESLIHEQLGDLSRARDICESYLKGHPDDAGVLLRLGVVLFRIGDEPGLANVLSRVDYQGAAANVDHARALGQLLIQIGKSAEALEILYQARRRNMANPAAHLLYIAGTTQLRRDVDTPTVVGPDVALELTGAGAPGWMLCSAADDANPADGEYAPAHPVAKAVVGKRVGDAVVFPENPAISWRVAAVDSKYAFAFRQSLSVFPARFPTERSIEVHETPGGEPGRFVEQLKERLIQGEPHREAVLASYAAGQITLGSVASALHCSTAEAIGAVTASKAGLIGSTGAPDEKEAVANVLRSRDVVLVADVTSCILLDSLGVLRDGSLDGSKFAITQTTLDEFRTEVLQWRSHPPDGFMSLGIRQGQLIRVEVTAEDIRSLRDRYESLAAWLKERCAVLAVSPAVAEKHAQWAKLGEFLGTSFWDSLLVASEPGRALLSDDLKLRRLYTQVSGQVSVCSPLLLLAEANGGKLAKDRYHTCVADLLVAGYRHVSIDANVLTSAARAAQWHPEGRLLRVLDGLKGPETEFRSAAIVAAQFFRELWFDVVLPQQREKLWFAVLDALSSGRPPASVLPFFKSLLRGVFALLPTAESSAMAVVAAWEALRERRAR